MAQTVLLKRSALHNNIPTTANLALGEIALNTYDGKLFIRKDNGVASIIELTSSSNLSFTPSLNLISTTVENAINELDTNKQPLLVSGSNIRTINGNTLLGSTDLVINSAVPLTDDINTNATMYPVFATAVSGNMTGKASSTKLTFNPSTGSLKSSNIGGNVVTTNYSSTYSNSVVTTSTSITALLSQPITSFYSFDLIVQAIEGSNFHTTKLLIVQDGTNAYISESNTIQNNIPLGIYDANIIGGNIVISVTPTSTNSTMFNFSCVMLSKNTLMNVAGDTTPSGPTGGSGASTFNALTDAPSSYVGQGGKLVRVKTDESGIEFYYPSIGTNTITYTLGTESGVIDLRTLVGIAYKVTLDITSITGTSTMNFINNSGTIQETFTTNTTKTIFDTDFTHNIYMNGTCTILISVYYKL
jgi:hypothetical protein